MVEITHLDASPDTRVPKASVRAADGTAAAAILGLNFGSAEQRGETLVVRIRPDEWYLLGDGAPAMAAGLDLSGFASTVDISHSRTAVRITGDCAAHTLSKLGSADFSDHMTPNGAALAVGAPPLRCPRELRGARALRHRSRLVRARQTHRRLPRLALWLKKGGLGRGEVR